jgi:riboflavin kinase/FMN adenylyltransferase
VRIVREPFDVPPVPGRVVTIGAFDGVHLGHRAVLRLVRELATARRLASAVVTFDRHPAEVVRPDSAPTLLTTLDEKLELLDATGSVEECVVITFDEARSKETAEEFVEEVLVGALRSRVVVVGADFHFGYRRRGNIALLQQMGADLGFEVLGLGLVAAPDGLEASADAIPYSSTRIRLMLAEGDVAAAAEMLGRDHSVAGVVERGDARGRELGFPTANVAVADRMCVPGDGVYAGHLVLDGAARPAAISIGRRPTFYEDGGLRLVEAYVLDFPGAADGAGDLYDQAVRVSFRVKLRDQIRFRGADAAGQLAAQMRLDVDRTREVLGG